MSDNIIDTNEKIVFNSLRIENFRGFYDAQEIPLDASAVIISGPNGQGKTTVFDGIQWLILSRIPRLEQLRYRKNENYIVNRYAQEKNLLASVEARINKNGHLVIAKRTGDHENNLLEVELDDSKVVGEQAQYVLQSILGVPGVRQDRLGSDFLSTALLEQDLVRAFLAISTSGERYELLSRVLGVDIVNEFVEKLNQTESSFADRVKKVEKSLGETRVVINSAHEQLNELSIRINTSPILTETVSKLKDKLNEIGLGSIISTYETEKDAKFLKRDIRQYRQFLSNLNELVSEIRVHFSHKPSSTLQELRDLVSEVKNKLDFEKSDLKTNEVRETEARETFQDATIKADSLKQVASLSIGLLADRCPVCDQKIDPMKVRTRLESLIAKQPGLSNAKATYEHVHTEYLKRLKKVAALEDRYNKICSDLKIFEIWNAKFTQLSTEIEKSSMKFINCNFPLPVPIDYSIIDWLSFLENWQSGFAEKLGIVEELADKLIAAQSVVEEKQQYDILEKEVIPLKKLYEKRELEVTEAQKARQNRKRLCENSREAAAKVVDDAFIQLEPVVQDLFARLAPHPTFNVLSLAHDVYYRKGSTMPYAEDEQTKLKINPAIGFSSAQVNVAALCYFIALAFASSETDFNFILLDDPLQSMDDVNVLGFSDLCRFIRREKQLLISTHEDRLGNLLTRKLTARDEPLQTLRLLFSSWDRSGPCIQPERISMLHTEPVIATLA